VASRLGPAGEPLLGSADIQSLADLGNSYEVSGGACGVVPFTRDTVLRLVVITPVPLTTPASR
jgi:hypothetical protein